jgi:sialate O-acetylesterase
MSTHIIHANLKKICFIILFSFSAFKAHSLVKLPAFFSDNCIFQQNSTIKIWGTGIPKKCVTIHFSWNKDEQTVKINENGKWEMTFQSPKASYTKHTITFDDGDILKLSNVLFGEVWLCSGQSNMEMPIKGFPNQPIALADSIVQYTSDIDSGIHFFTVKRNASNQPTEELNGKWLINSTKNVSNFSATAYFFALKLQKELNIPVGIINSSWGGSPIESWIPAAMNQQFSDYDTTTIYNEPSKLPARLYNGMIHPLKDYKIKGFVWYQGEANTDRYATYEQKLTGLIQQWRSDWNLGDLPFFLVEIAPYLYQNGLNAPRLRAAQFKASITNNTIGIVCTNDLVSATDSMNIHPPRKKEIGDRLANLALFNTYQNTSIQALSPTFSNSITQKDTLILTLNNVYDSILPMPKFTGFEIAGEDGVFYPAKAILSENKQQFYLTSEKVLFPLKVNYCFKNFQLGNVKNSAGLPLFPFSSAE